jgi:ABC-type antimicrobial peptide transport system permease subunit
VRLRGVNHEYFAISNMRLAEGQWISPWHVEGQYAVCVLGAGIAQDLIPVGPKVGVMVSIAIDERNAFACQIIGVLESQKSHQEWFQPNLQILIPYTTFQSVGSWWNSRIQEFALQAQSEGDVEDIAKRVKAFFELRYGNSGRFIVDTEGTLVAQTKRFLSIFAALLASIAFLSLLVGGIGIHNMMLVSVTERLKEIGLRKAVGATSRSIKIQVLVESTTLCLVAGLLGIIAGIGATEVMIFAATKFIKNLEFQWLIDPWALSVSFVSIFAVGILSGLVPALRAEKLQVIEALRSE